MSLRCNEVRVYLLMMVAFVLIGCSESRETKLLHREKENAKNLDAELAKPWAGLYITTAGIELEKADQIVIMLHGYGASDADMQSLAPYLRGEKRGFVFPGAPFPVGQGLCWGKNQPEFDIARAKAVGMIRYVTKTYPNAKIVIGGFSQGATMSSTLLTDESLPIDKMILYSPKPHIQEDQIASNDKLQVFLSHGERDNVLPFKGSEDLAAVLKKKGIKTSWRSFDGGHEVPLEVLKSTLNFLEKDSESSNEQK